MGPACKGSSLLRFNIALVELNSRRLRVALGHVIISTSISESISTLDLNIMAWSSRICRDRFEMRNGHKLR